VVYCGGIVSSEFSDLETKAALDDKTLVGFTTIFAPGNDRGLRIQVLGKLIPAPFVDPIVHDVLAVAFEFPLV